MYARWGTPHNNSSINFYVRLCGHFLAKSVLAELRFGNLGAVCVQSGFFVHSDDGC